MVIIPARTRTGATIWARYAENAKKVPIEICPLIASQPPSKTTPTWPSAGMACSAGLYRAVSRTARTREA